MNAASFRNLNTQVRFQWRRPAHVRQDPPPSWCVAGNRMGADRGARMRRARWGNAACSGVRRARDCCHVSFGRECAYPFAQRRSGSHAPWATPRGGRRSPTRPCPCRWPRCLPSLHGLLRRPPSLRSCGSSTESTPRGHQFPAKSLPRHRRRFAPPCPRSRFRCSCWWMQPIHEWSSHAEIRPIPRATASLCVSRTGRHLCGRPNRRRKACGWR